MFHQAYQPKCRPHKSCLDIRINIYEAARGSGVGGPFTQYSVGLTWRSVHTVQRRVNVEVRSHRTA